MKLSKVLHVGSVLVGFAGVISFLIAVFGAAETAFGISKADALACSAILILVAIWAQIGAIHHMMLEGKGEIV